MKLYIDRMNGWRIREVRMQKGITGKDLAARIGTYPERLYKAEKGAMYLDMVEIMKIAELLETPIEYFWT